ncbi:thiamine pyrophosphate-binding protein [Kaarinaea lacus]
MYGGELIAKVLSIQGVKYVFTLCGGHISPILVAAKKYNIKVIDTRHEATAVFAADAMSRMTGIPGIAIVTAGPGATNTLTAVKNATLAMSRLIIIAGAPATALRGRGALQDVDLVELFSPAVKWCTSVSTVKDLVTTLERAFSVCQEKTPGPVFIECPVDLLYEESLVRKVYGIKERSHSLKSKAVNFYLSKHVDSLFKHIDEVSFAEKITVPSLTPNPNIIKHISDEIAKSSRPLLLVGSQAVMSIGNMAAIAAAIQQLNIPVYLTSMARGLLGEKAHLQMHHQRKQALQDADLVLLAGVPCDFRLGYGKQIGGRATLIAANRSKDEIHLNCHPEIASHCDPGALLIALAEAVSVKPEWTQWLEQLRQLDNERVQEMIQQGATDTENINPIQLLNELNIIKSPNSIIIADGGDFVATASYIVTPPAPLSWLDPGPYGTLGVGAGFALSAKLCNPEKEVWIIFGDGALGYSLAEFDTFCRHGIPVIGLVGNDACWSQVARDQVDIFNDDIGTTLAHTRYDKVVEGFGVTGFLLNDPASIRDVLREAQTQANKGHTVLVNAMLSKSEFRKGSISM